MVMDSSCVCVCVSACFYFHLLHPVLGSFAGVLMPDVVSGVSESHGTHSVLHIHLPLIHLPGSKICVSYRAKNCCWEGTITTYASQMEKKLSIAWL